MYSEKYTVHVEIETLENGESEKIGNYKKYIKLRVLLTILPGNDSSGQYTYGVRRA